MLELLLPLFSTSLTWARSVARFQFSCLDFSEVAFCIKPWRGWSCIQRHSDLRCVLIKQTAKRAVVAVEQCFDIRRRIVHQLRLLKIARKVINGTREQNYSVGEREALAIISAVEKFHRYLYGQHFTLESDHKPLEYLQTSHSKNARLMRWGLALQPYRYTVRYIRGCETVVADYLSRT